MDLHRSQKNLTIAASLAEKIQLSVLHAATIKTAEALCPELKVPSLPDEIAQKVAATGLEACHIVLASVKEIGKSIKSFRSKKLYRALIASSKAQLWALEAFTPSCSRLTERTVQSTIKYMTQQIERDMPVYRCRIWQDVLTAEMKDVRKLNLEKKWDKAIDLLDTKGLAAVHGVSSTCDNPAFGENASKRWVSRRQRIQRSMHR
ncbi:MAG: hypothetical protein COA78_28370 [Blastopirellula sp.]|nr:MAG: hypothetical protein COA78_28370 [Blastopirellula sp.]